MYYEKGELILFLSKKQTHFIQGNGQKEISVRINVRWTTVQQFSKKRKI